MEKAYEKEHERKRAKIGSREEGRIKQGEKGSRENNDMGKIYKIIGCIL